MKELLRKKSVKIMLLLIVLLVVMGIVGMNAQSAQGRKEYNGHIEAAEKYLTELDYEQAIAEYTLALEIEPNAEEVLNGLEQTYLAYAQSVADGGDYERAVSILEEGYAVTGRESLKDKSNEFQALQEQLAAEQSKAESEELELQAYMRKLYDMMAEENYSDVIKTMWEAGQSGYTKGLQYEKYTYFPEKNDSLTGTGIGFYRFHDWDGNVDTSYYENLAYYSYYYGSYVDGKREGYGVSVFGFYIFKGEWKNDAPNGWGELITHDNDKEDGFASRMRGNLVDGLWNGTVEYQWYNADGTLRDMSFYVDNGVPEDRTEEYWAFSEEWFGREVSAEEREERLSGQYVYHYEGDKENENPIIRMSLFNKGNTMGIWEFAKDWR